MSFLPSYSLPLSPKVPGFAALNSFSADSRRTLLLRLLPERQEAQPTASIFEARKTSALTANPFLRTNSDQAAWDKTLLALVAKGFEARGLYMKSLKALKDLLEA